MFIQFSREKIRFAQFMDENNFLMPRNGIEIPTETVCAQFCTIRCHRTHKTLPAQDVTVENEQKRYETLNLYCILHVLKNKNSIYSILSRSQHRFDCVHTRPANTKR